jgi:peptidoglycan hydrolase-like protein with peptidoglycan-binding domain
LPAKAVARVGAFAVLSLLVLAAPAVAASGGTSYSAASAAPRGDSKHLGDRVLRKGMRGHDVRVLQSYLTLAGFSTSVTGYFGSVTRTNVIAFQKAHNFRANGVVTIPVEKTLRAAVASIEADFPPPSGTTQINSDGTATAPANAPSVVKAVVAAANQIHSKPYVYGGGHRSFNSSGYDCSGSVSFALHGGNLLASPEASSGLESFGDPGPGRWITVYANSGHAYATIAGLRWDTAGDAKGTGPRWHTDKVSSSGYVKRHPRGY